MVFSSPLADGFDHFGFAYGIHWIGVFISMPIYVYSAGAPCISLGPISTGARTKIVSEQHSVV
jgi:hypothetical protein